jgi:hypothetical protein
MHGLLQMLAAGLLLLGAGLAPAQPIGGVDPEALDQNLRALKEEVLGLNRDLLVLEEDLLYPASTQLSVFVSLDVGELFRLDSVQLKLGDRVLANHLYSEHELAALGRGGVHRLYIGNLKAGSHELVAFFTGKGPNGRDYRRAADLKLDKGSGAKYVELKIADLERKQQPEFVVKEWE